MVDSTRITAGFSEDQVRRYYSVFLNTVGTVVKSYGAIVIKTTGDGMLFYMPGTSDCRNESAFDRVLECCFALLDESHSINRIMNREGLPPMSYRISADYGNVQVSNTNDLFGSTVNICAKINRTARPDSMVIGADLHRIVSASKKYHFKEVYSYKIDKKFQYSVYAVQRVDNKAAVAAHISPVVPGGDLPRVMLVDDEDDVLATYRMFLSNYGYFVDAFNDSEQALANFAKLKQYSLVVLDIRMPKINGLQLFQRMKAINSKTNIMFVTAVDAVDEIKTILPGSGATVIKKPVGKEQFISKVNSLIGLA